MGAKQSKALDHLGGEPFSVYNLHGAAPKI
jgi:hypothetical protein